MALFHEQVSEREENKYVLLRTSFSSNNNNNNNNNNPKKKDKRPLDSKKNLDIRNLHLRPSIPHAHINPDIHIHTYIHTDIHT